MFEIDLERFSAVMEQIVEWFKKIFAVIFKMVPSIDEEASTEAAAD